MLLVGLGNPGEQYRNTRHNIGSTLLKLLAKKLSVSFLKDSRSKSRICTLTYALSNKSVSGYLLCPETFMNLSGQSVFFVSKYYDIHASNIIVVHDDIELSFGVVKHKFSGGAAGHNGLRSLDASLKSKDYHRIRVGVGRPIDPRVDVSSYVLSNFTPDELAVIETTMFDDFIRIFELIISSDSFV